MPDQPVALPPQGDKLEDVETDDEDRIAGCQPSLRQPGGHPRHLRMESAPAARQRRSAPTLGLPLLPAALAAWAVGTRWALSPLAIWVRLLPAACSRLIASIT
jgi:hypothetical protein